MTAKHKKSKRSKSRGKKRAELRQPEAIGPADASAGDAAEAEAAVADEEKPRWAWLGHRDLIVIVTWVVFLNALPNGFHLDDYYRVVDNPGIHKVWPISRHFVDPRTSTTAPHLVQFRPLLPLTLSINYAIGGDSVGGYHVGNLLFHVLSALLVYSLCLELLGHWSTWCKEERQRRWLALGVALIFGVHPVSGIPVNYICARDLLIMQCFLLASLLAYVRMRRLGETPLRWAWVLLALALSLMAKTNAIVAPGLIVLFEFFVAKESLSSRKLWLRAAAFAGVIVAYLLYTQLGLGFSDFANVVGVQHGPRWEYPLTQLKLHLWEYMRNFFWPFMIRQGPHVEPARSLLEPAVLTGAIFIVWTVALAWQVRRSAPLLAFCILAYWTLMIPEASVLRLHHIAAYYRAYAPSPFFYLAMGLLLYKHLKPDLLARVFWLALVFYSGSSIYLNSTWRTDETLWSYSVKYGGEPVAHLNLGMSKSDPHARKKHLEDALRLAPNYVIAHIDLGLVLIRLGETKEGLEHLERAVELEPNTARPHYWLSSAYATLGRKREAADESAEAARLDPRNLKYQLKAARNAQAIGDYEGSLGHLEAIGRYEPDYKNALFLKGFALQRTGELAGAIGAYRAFLTHKPDHCQAHFNLGFALMKTGQHPQAIEHLERVLSLKPDYDAAHLHLGTCYEKVGDERAAAKHRRIYEERNE